MVNKYVSINAVYVYIFSVLYRAATPLPTPKPVSSRQGRSFDGGLPPSLSPKPLLRQRMALPNNAANATEWQVGY